MRLYDFERAKNIIINAAGLESAALGIHEYWLWTAENVFENGEFVKELTQETEIGGINGSVWATPTLQLIYKDGQEKMIPVFIGSADDADRAKEGRMFAEMSRGPLSGPTQENILPLSDDDQ